MTAGALAQSVRGLVGGPLTTARFERLAGLYLRVTDEEMQSLDRLHESYLDRFRAEIEPAITAMSVEMQVADPDERQFEELLRRLDRVGVRIGEADGAFFGAAAELVGEAQRGGVARMRAARERQRQLGGIASMATMTLGNGTSFVDLLDVLARERFAGAVPEESRARLDAFVQSQGERLGAQARAYAVQARATFVAWFASSKRSEEGREPGGVDPAAAGKGLMKAVRLNHEANRAACAQLEGVLAPLALASFREELALRAIGSGVFLYLGSWISSELSDTVRRVRKEPSLGPEAQAALDDAETAWRAGRAKVLDGFLAMLDEKEVPSHLMQYAMLDEGVPAQAELAELQAEVERAGQALDALSRGFTERLVAILGERADAYFREVAPGPGAPAEQGPRFEPRTAELAGDDAAAEPEAGDVPATFDPGESTPVSEALVIQSLALAGVEADPALVETVYESWRSAKWDKSVEPLNRAYAEAARGAQGFDDDGVRYEPSRFGAMRDAGLAVVAAVAESHGALVADLSGALGRPVEDPGFMLLRLWELERLRGADGSVVMRGDNPMMPGVHRVLLLAGASPDEVRAILSDRPEEWRSIASEVRAVEARIVESSHQLLRLQAEIDARGGATTEQDSRRWTALSEERTAAVDAVRDRLCRRIEESLAATVADPERRRVFTRALARQVYPDFFGPGDSAESALDAAARTGGLDDDQRARIDAMRAEYLAVFDDLSERMIAAARRSTAGAAAAPGDDAERYAASMEESARLRLDRTERTNKVLAELRRILGPERASRVPGLVRKERDALPESIWELFEPED